MPEESFVVGKWRHRKSLSMHAVAGSADYACQPGLERRHHLCADASWLHVLGRCVINWHSRYVLACQLSNTRDCMFCLDALRQALCKGRPKIFNTDQGAQFTAEAFTTALRAANIQVSMDGRGRALDNVFCERLWRSVKYANNYLNQYDTVRQLQTGLEDYFVFYNNGWVGEGTSCLNGYFFPKPPVKPDVIVSHHPAFSVLPR